MPPVAKTSHAGGGRPAPATPTPWSPRRPSHCATATARSRSATSATRGRRPARGRRVEPDPGHPVEHRGDAGTAARPARRHAARRAHSALAGRRQAEVEKIVDSSATTGRPSSMASTSSGERSIIVSRGYAGRHRQAMAGDRRGTPALAAVRGHQEAGGEGVAGAGGVGHRRQPLLHRHRRRGGRPGCPQLRHRHHGPSRRRRCRRPSPRAPACPRAPGASGADRSRTTAIADVPAGGVRGPRAASPPAWSGEGAPSSIAPGRRRRGDLLGVGEHHVGCEVGEGVDADPFEPGHRRGVDAHQGARRSRPRGSSSCRRRPGAHRRGSRPAGARPAPRPGRRRAGGRAVQAPRSVRKDHSPPSASTITTMVPLRPRRRTHTSTPRRARSAMRASPAT